MPDNLIRDQVRAKQPSSGIGSNFNLDNLESSKRSVGSMADSANRVLGVQEKRKRAEAEEMAAADMVEFSAYMSEMKTGYDIALSQTVDPEEIQKLSEEYEAESREYVDGDQLRQQISKDRANEYLTKNSPNLFKNAAELRVTAVNEAESIAKLEIGVAQVKKNPGLDDKIFESKLRDIYAELVSMGKLTPTQAKQKLGVDMEQKKRDEAIFVTAGFQTQMNDLTQVANIETAKLWNEFVGQGIMDQAVGKGIAEEIEKNFQISSNQMTANYKQEIVDLGLTPPEERKLLSALDEDSDYRSKFIKSIEAQVKKANTNKQIDNDLKHMEYLIQSGNPPQTLQQLNEWDLSPGYKKSYLSGRLTEEKAVRKESVKALLADTKATEKANKERVKDIRANIKNFVIAHKVTASLDVNKMNPDSDPYKYKALVEAIGNLPPLLKAEAMSEINNHRDPKKYYSEINQSILEWDKRINSKDGDKTFLEEFDVDVPDDTEFPDDLFSIEGIKQARQWQKEWVTWERAANAEEKSTMIKNIKKKAREIYRDQGFLAADKYLNDQGDVITQDRADDEYFNKTMDMSFNRPPQEEFINPLTGSKDMGIPHDIGSEIKRFQAEGGQWYEYNPFGGKDKKGEVYPVENGGK